METTIIKIDPAEFGLENDKAVEVESAFAPVIIERDALLEVYANILNSEMSEQLTEDARQLRLKLVKVRTSTDKVHRVQKAFYLAGGRFVDAWKTRNNTVIEQMEDKLSEIENYYINIENARIEALKVERMAKLSEVCDTPELFQVELMTDAAFDQLLEGQKLAKQARIAAEKKAEEDRLAAIETKRIHDLRVKDLIPLWKYLTEDEKNMNFGLISFDEFLSLFDKTDNKRIAEEKEQEEIRKENEKLQKEKEDREKEIEAKRQRDAKRNNELRPYIVFIRDYSKLLESSESDYETEFAGIKISAQQQWDFDEKQLKDKEKTEKDRIANEKKAANAPVKTKVTVWIDSLEMPDMGENVTVADIRAKFDGFKAWAKSQLNNL